MIELLFCIIIIMIAIALGSAIIGAFTYSMCNLMEYLDRRKYRG